MEKAIYYPWDPNVRQELEIVLSRICSRVSREASREFIKHVHVSSTYVLSRTSPDERSRLYKSSSHKGSIMQQGFEGSVELTKHVNNTSSVRVKSYIS